MISDANDPGQYQFDIDSTDLGGSGLEGTIFQIYIKALNNNGNGGTDSEIASIVLGDVPSAPPTPPEKISEESSASVLAIGYPSISTSLNNGLAILSYSLEIDYGNGIFVPLTGYLVDSLATKYTIANGSIVKGNHYSVRYRARNAYGWGAYSAEASLLVAQVPNRPSSAPEFVSSTDTQLIVSLDLNVGNGGAAISEYVLQISSDNGVTYSDISSYDGISSQHTLDSTTDSLTTGAVYRLRYFATNVIGDGEASNELVISLTAAPATPNAPYRDEQLCSKTSITI